jgi:uncharacterized protein (UPF0333 family)
LIKGLLSLNNKSITTLELKRTYLYPNIRLIVMHRKAQASLEYIVIVGVVLILLIPLFYYVSNASAENIKIAQIEDAVNSLAKAADDVYALSPGTKKYVWVSIPGGVEGKFLNASEIVLTIGGSDIVAITKATVVGEIPTDKGTHKVPVELLDSGVVRIGSGDDTTPPVIVWKSPSGLTCNPITLKVNTNEPSTCKYDTVDNTYNNMNFQMSGNSLGHSEEFGAQQEGNYNYFVRCRDAFDNNMPSSDIINYTLNLTICSQGGLVNDTTPPNVTLINPQNGHTENISRVYFFYNVTDESAISFCDLIINGTIENTVTSPDRYVLSNITGDLDMGTYQWSINCTDITGKEGNSSFRTVNVNATLDDDFPVVNLIKPLNGTNRSFNFIKLSYNVTDLISDIDFCTLRIYSILDNGGVASQSSNDFSITEGEMMNFSATLGKGIHSWNVTCYDDSIYSNANTSETWQLGINVTSEESFITGCSGQCGLEGYYNGICRQSEPKCEQNNEFYWQPGDIFCTGGAQSDTCCCVP